MILDKERKKSATLMKKRKIAVVCFLLTFAILLGVYVMVAQFMKPTVGYIDSDGTTYYVKYKNGAYAMYNKNGDRLQQEAQFGYFVTEFGTLVEIDSQTGECLTQIIVDDLQDGEDTKDVTNNNVRILMFPHVENDDILQLEVHNSHGSYTLMRVNEIGELSASGDLVLKNALTINFDPERMPALCTGAGYTISTQKIKDPIKDANGLFSEYGLVPETRVDDEGNEYEYQPAYYILTDRNGNKHKIILGDLLPSGADYYAQYVKIDENGNETPRDAVYVLGHIFTQNLYLPIEDFVKPMLAYPTSTNDYFDVANFYLTKFDGEDYNEIVNFSYIDLAERENTLNALFPYVFGSELDGYYPSSDNISTCLQAFHDPKVVDVVEVLITDRNYYRNLTKYGFYTEYKDEAGETKYRLTADYVVTYDFDILDDNGKVVDTINNFIMFCGPNENGNYYAYSVINTIKGEGEDREAEMLYSYDLVLEVDGKAFGFLEYDRSKWISRSYLFLNIAYCDEIKIESSKYSAIFDLDNSASDNSTMTSSDRLVIRGSDSLGNNLTTFGGLEFFDTNGYHWVITSTGITVKDSAGDLKTIASGKYTTNSMGLQTYCFDGYVTTIDGSKVYVYPDTVKVNFPDGSSREYLRYGTDIFRDYYEVFLNATIVDSYELSEEEEKALISDPDKLLMTVTMTNTEGKTMEYKFYSITSRKAYITINGNGGFYVLTNRLDKFVSDAQKFFRLEPIDPTAIK